MNPIFPALPATSTRLSMVYGASDERSESGESGHNHTIRRRATACNNDPEVVGRGRFRRHRLDSEPHHAML